MNVNDLENRLSYNFKSLIGSEIHHIPNIRDCINSALELFERNALSLNTKYYLSKPPVFNPFNSDHFCMFLYFLSRVYYQKKEFKSAEKFFLLNRYLNSIDLFYTVNLPLPLMLVHPLGSVIGNSTFGSHTVIYQGVTIGATSDGIYPVFKGKNILYSNVSIIGDCKIGENVIFGAGAAILNMEIPDNSIVTGAYKDIRVRTLKNNTTIEKLFY